jgi:ribosomal protein S18 acetylase RimI-like enzyme
MINVEKYPMDIMYIINIYMLPEFRKMGLSKIALATVMSQLFSENIIEIGLNVKVENDNAISLFSSLGMKKIYETGIYFKKENTAANKV